MEYAIELAYVHNTYYLTFTEMLIITKVIFYENKTMTKCVTDLSKKKLSLVTLASSW